MIHIIDTDAELHALEPEWQALWERTPDATPFGSPTWLLPWWAEFGTDAPRVAIERRGGLLGGVLPLYVLRESGETKLLPIGAGITDYLDAIGDPATLLPAVLDRARADGIACCDLFEVPPGSKLVGLAPPPGWRGEWIPGSACPVLTFPNIPPGIRRKLRMNRNRADRDGGWTMQTAAPDTIEAMQAALIRLHQARWTAQGEAGVLESSRVLAFHRRAAPRLLDAGLLRLTTLCIGDEVAAAILAFLAPGRIFFYLSGFDERRSFVSPGTLLLGAMLEQAMEEGRSEAHFLRGQEGYKYAWGAADRLSMRCRYTIA